MARTAAMSRVTSPSASVTSSRVRWGSRLPRTSPRKAPTRPVATLTRVPIQGKGDHFGMAGGTDRCVSYGAPSRERLLHEPASNDDAVRHHWRRRHVGRHVVALVAEGAPPGPT